MLFFLVHLLILWKNLTSQVLKVIIDEIQGVDFALNISASTEIHFHLKN
jgi:hypothetical protein